MIKENTRSYPSKFGLVQITRQRVRPEVNIKTREEDQTMCGEIEAPNH
jgi:ribonuclease G